MRCSIGNIPRFGIVCLTSFPRSPHNYEVSASLVFFVFFLRRTTSTSCLTVSTSPLQISKLNLCHYPLDKQESSTATEGGWLVYQSPPHRPNRLLLSLAFVWQTMGSQTRLRRGGKNRQRRGGGKYFGDNRGADCFAVETLR